MTNKTYAVVLEIFDYSESDGEDVEEVLEDILRENLPRDLEAHIVSFEEVEE